MLQWVWSLTSKSSITLVQSGCLSGRANGRGESRQTIQTSFGLSGSCSSPLSRIALPRKMPVILQLRAAWNAWPHQLN